MGPSARTGAVFQTDVPLAFQASRTSGGLHPFEIAKDFAQAIIPETAYVKGELDGAVAFYVHNNSCVDSNTGIVHVYLRQAIFRSEVANEDVNVAIDSRASVRFPMEVRQLPSLRSDIAEAVCCGAQTHKYASDFANDHR